MNLGPTNIYSQFCKDVQTSVQNIEGVIPAQVQIGNIEFGLCEEFYREVATNGWYFFIGLPSAQGDFFRFEGQFEVECRLWFPVPADKSYNWDAPNGMMTNIIVALSHYGQPGNSQWVYGQNRSPVRFKHDKPKIRYYVKECSKFLSCEQAYAVSWDLTLTMPMITDQLTPPYGPIEQPSVTS